MKKYFLLWLIAFVLTVFNTFYQQTTGQIYPVSGEATVIGEILEHKLERIHTGEAVQKVKIKLENESICGEL